MELGNHRFHNEDIQMRGFEGLPHIWTECDRGDMLFLAALCILFLPVTIIGSLPTFRPPVPSPRREKITISRVRSISAMPGPRSTSRVASSFTFLDLLAQWRLP